MKIFFSKQKRTDGGTLLLTLFIVTSLSLGLGSYLYLVRAENTSVVRSQAWNDAMATAEAGVEEALAQMNPASRLYNSNIDFSANSWGGPTSGSYGPVTRSLSNAFYSVRITTDVPPIIYSTGSVTNKTLGTVISREVRVSTSPSGLYNGAGMVVFNTLNMSGNNVTTDSYDSSKGPYSSQTPGTNGNVASLYGVVNVQNGDIYGNLYLGPTASYTTHNTNNIHGTVFNDFNLDYPTVDPPFISGMTPTGTSTYTLASGSGNYMVNGDLSGTIVVPTNIQAALYVTGNLGSQSTVSVNIQPGASLKLYVGGATGNFNPPNFIGTTNPIPSQFQYYGLPGNTNVSITLTGNTTFYGTIYDPSASFTGKGNGTFYGAMIVGSVTMTGNGAFHYDLQLAGNPIIRGYIATDWQEVLPGS